MKKSPLLLFYLVLLAILFTFKGNSQNVIYTPLYSSSNFTKTISLTAPVGTVAGMPDAAGGSASYTIPIATPPGTNGVVPSVSVTYSSLSGSGGIAGMGWNIGGLSAISRTGANFYFDGNVKPVDLSSNDRFLLDGSRLISKTGTYGAIGATYGTEIENFATITSYDVMGGDPGYFIVEAKDGTIMEYGKSTDSRFLNASNSEVLLWRLNKILYKDGNYILFKYTNVDRDPRIDEILYTGNDFAGLTPYNKIKFSYLVRTDIKTVYEAGIPVVSKFLLDKITITAEAGVAFKTYTFNYATNNNINSFLNAVFEAGSDGSTLNSTIFKYGDLPTAFQSNTSSALVNQYLDIFPGDFNGDGYSDMLTCTRDQVNIGRHTDFKVYIKSPSASNTSFTVPTASGTVSLASYEVIGKYYNFFSGDYTGDGADDVMIANVTGSGNNKVLEHVRIHESKLNGTDFQTYVQRVPQPTWSKIHSSGKYIVQGDFDGDGLMDFITMLGSNTTNVFNAFLCTGSVGVGACGGIIINGASSIPVADWVTCNRVDAVDFNGDGKTDLMLVKPGLTEIYTFEGLTAKRIYTRSFPDSYHLLFFGDFNGDNKTDLLVRNSLNDNNALWYKHISTGTDYIESPFTFVQKPDITGTYFRDKILIADYNGDGKMDIAHGWNETSGTTAKVDIYYSRGDNFYSERYSYTSAFVGSPTVFTFDSNGDGRMEFMSRNYYADPFNILSFNKEGKDLLLHKVKNGIDHTCEWNYKRMTEAGTFYTRGSLTAYPLNNIQAPINLVSSLSTSNGIGSNATTLYNYGEAKFHRRGKGWLGFKLTTATNSTLGTRTVSENEINTTFYMAAPYKISTYLTSDNSLLSEVTYTNQFTEQSLGSKRVWVKTTGVNENRAFQKQTTTTANTYDTFGNITQNVVNNNNEETTTTSATFGTFGTPIPAKPTLITVSNTRLGSTAYNVSTSFTYNNTGQLTGKTEFSNQTQNVVYAYTYNLLGNQTGVTATPSGMTARGGSSIFDSKGRYALSITNALSQTATATYDAKWGKSLTQTGIDGLTTSFQYDAFGRLTTTTFPTGVTVTETYGWDINATNGTINFHLSSSAGKPDRKVWFDLLGREKKSQTEGFQSLWMTKLTTYDARGNVATETAPYKSGETVLTTTHTYDTYNRITSSSNTIGTTSVAYSYANDGKLTTTITDPAAELILASPKAQAKPFRLLIMAVHSPTPIIAKVTRHRSNKARPC
jgi:YD repeat-containing protein